MARAVTTSRKTVNTLAAWAVALTLFFPILWTVLTSFKPEAVAVASPPVFLAFDWTLENYADVQEQRDYFRYFLNSMIISVGSTLLGLLLAVPAASPRPSSSTSRSRTSTRRCGWGCAWRSPSFTRSSEPP